MIYKNEFREVEFDPMTIEDLKQIIEMKKTLEQLEQGFVNIDYEKVSSVQYDGAGTKSKNHDQLEKAALSIIEKKEAIQMQYYKLAIEYIERSFNALNIITLIKNEKQMLVLEYRYLDCLSISEILDKMNSSDRSSYHKLLNRAHTSFLNIQTECTT